MSLGLNAVRYGVAAVIIAGVLVAASFLYVGTPAQSASTRTASGIQGAVSKLVIQLTDPPQVPDATTSLNMTYGSFSLLVGEPSGHPGQFNTTTVPVTPSGGSATLALLKLQNVSETLGTVTIPNGSIIYSVAFAVSSITIDVNGTVSAVSLAGGGSTLVVTISNPRGLSGTNVALLQLNPVVVQTPTGYELIPSSVGVIKPSNGSEDEAEGSLHQLSANETRSLENAHGNVTAALILFSVSGNRTTITVQLKDVGNGSVVVNAVSIHGNFTVLGKCGGESHGHHSSSTTTSQQCQDQSHPDEVVFLPSNSTLYGTACANVTMQLVNGDGGHDSSSLTLNPGQCVNLTFAGVISFGESGQVLVPSTASGQIYLLHVIASHGANLSLACTLPAGPASCKAEHHGHD